MKTAICKLKSAAPYSQSKYHQTEKKDKETHEDYEKRTWQEKQHYDKSGYVFIPPMAFKNCLAECAKFLSIQIPGKGKATYTKHFEAGLMVTDPMVLPFKKDEVAGEWFHVPSDGMRGGKRRVLKCFPVIPEWEGELIVYILDDTITESVFEQHLNEAGKFIGVGRFRPRNNGFYGRFTVEGIKFE